MTPSDQELREPASEKTLRTETRQCFRNVAQIIGYIQTGKVLHNCPTTNLVGWHLTKPFSTRAAHSAWGRVAFELRVPKLMAIQSCEGDDKLAP
jgi:hypothetical protein